MRCPSFALLLTAMLAGGVAWGQVPPPPQDPVADLLGLFFVPSPAPLGDAEISGLPAGSKTEALTWQRAYALALIRARAAKPPRFESLDAGRIDAESEGLGVADFARFRADLTTNPAFRDPSADFLDLQARRIRIENGRWVVAHLEKLMAQLQDLIRGESSGLTQLELDQLYSSLWHERRVLGREVAEYRDRLDVVKVSLGLAPRAAVAVEVATLAPFRESFDRSNRWFLDPGRRLEDLGRHIASLPTPGDVVIEGRPILGELAEAPDRLEEILGLAARVALGAREGAGDEVELRVRERIRHLAEIRLDYEAARRMASLAARQSSQAFEQLISPPGSTVANGRAGQFVLSLTTHTQRIAESRSRLVALWCEFHAERLALHRDLGRIPYEDWAAFYGQFEAHPGKVEEPEPEVPSIPPPAPKPPGAEGR